MLAIQIGLTLLSANIAIHTQEARGASAENVSIMARQFALATALRTGQTTSVTKQGMIETCLDVHRCVSAVRVETGADHVILIRIIALPSRIRLAATLVLSALDTEIPKAAIENQEKMGPLQHSIDLSRDTKSWPKAFAKLSDDLFEAWEKPAILPMAPPISNALDQTKQGTTIAIVTKNSQEEAQWIWRWSWLGSGAILAGSGMIADALMPSSHNQKLDGNDFIGPGLITAGILAGISGVFFNPHQESANTDSSGP
jgi:hypothetical protein